MNNNKNDLEDNDKKINNINNICDKNNIINENKSNIIMNNNSDNNCHRLERNYNNKNEKKNNTNINQNLDKNNENEKDIKYESTEKIENREEVIDMDVEIPKKSKANSIKIFKKNTKDKIQIPKKSYDYIFKVSLIGDTSTGKTSIILRFIDNYFKEETSSTIGVDFKIVSLELEKIFIQKFKYGKHLVVKDLNLLLHHILNLVQHLFLFLIYLD